MMGSLVPVFKVTKTLFSSLNDEIWQLKNTLLSAVLLFSKRFPLERHYWTNIRKLLHISFIH